MFLYVHVSIPNLNDANAKRNFRLRKLPTSITQSIEMLSDVPYECNVVCISSIVLAYYCSPIQLSHFAIPPPFDVW